MKHLFHILWKGCGEVQFLTVNGMDEGEAAGMESLTADSLHIRIVQIIPDQGSTETFEVDADLMCPSGFQHKAQKRILSIKALYMIVCNGGLTVFPVCRALNHRAGLTAQRNADRTVRGSGTAADNSQIFAADLLADGHAGEDARA